jgi:hypothetical protein
MISQFAFFITIAAICFSGLLFTLWTLGAWFLHIPCDMNVLSLSQRLTTLTAKIGLSPQSRG